MHTFKGDELINVVMTSDNNMYEAIYRDQNLRINASDLTDGIFNTLKKSNFTVQYPTWGYYRLNESRFFNILGRKLYLD
jgi:hypothetical protein